MTSRESSRACVCLLLVLVAPPLAAGVVMKSDGSSVQCLFDPAQTLTLTTASGDVTLPLGETVWLAGSETRRVRRTGTTALLTGSLAGGEIACYKSDKDRQKGKATKIATASVIFLSTDDVEVKKRRKMKIEEFDGGRLVTVEEVPAKDFFVEILPENWSSALRLLDPEYRTSMVNKETLTVRARVSGDGASLRDFADESKASDKKLTVRVESKDSTSTLSKPASDLLTAVRELLEKAGGDPPDPARLVEGAVSLDFGTPFHMEFGGQIMHSVTGTGTFLMYVEGGYNERLANDHLTIVNTASNVHRLPITLSE